jgi:hypothetical protein
MSQLSRDTMLVLHDGKDCQVMGFGESRRNTKGWQLRLKLNYHFCSNLVFWGTLVHHCCTTTDVTPVFENIHKGFLAKIKVRT